jgi:hypothetical protein
VRLLRCQNRSIYLFDLKFHYLVLIYGNCGLKLTFMCLETVVTLMYCENVLPR